MRGDLKFSAKNRGTLERWLKARCRWSDNVFDDPGYSSRYKSYFSGLFDDDTYIDGDIDHRLNIGHYELVYDESIAYDEFDEIIEPYIDFVPSNITRSDIEKVVAAYPLEDQERARKVYSRTGIVILPGSNHSNANYLYKRFIEYLNDVREFTVPYVGTFRDRYRPSYKRVGLSVSKETIYNFAYSVSTIDHQTQRMVSLLNLDRELEDRLASTWNGSADTDHYTRERTNNTDKGSRGELERIHESIDRLSREIDRYFGIIKGLWHDILLPFINSDDCCTLRYLSEYDYQIFEDFMTSQPVFGVMIASMQRLQEREAYIIR